MEFLTKRVVVLTASDTDEVDFVLPPWAIGFSFMVIPKDDGTGAPPDAPTLKIQYGASDGEHYDTNPPGTAATVVNEANVVTRSDGMNKLRLVLTNGATPPNGGALIELYAARASSAI